MTARAAPLEGQSVPATAPRPAAAPVAWTSAWSAQLDDPGNLMLAASEAFVLIAGPEVPLQARDRTSGALVWTHTVGSWQALAASHTLALGVAGDHAYALDAATGRTRWVTTTTGPNTRLLVDGPHVLVASDIDLLLRDLESGTPLWHAGLTAPPSAPVVMAGDTIVASTADGLLTVLARATGVPLWQIRVPGSVRFLAAGPSAIYVALANGTLCSYGAPTGGERWCFPLRVPFAGPPLVDGDRVRVALFDNSLRTFDRQSGSMHQPLSIGHRPASGPWGTPDAIVVALTSGEFAMLDRQATRVLSRLSVPGAQTSHVIESAAIAADRRAVAGITVATNGERRLTLYQQPPRQQLPVLASPPPLPYPVIQLDDDVATGSADVSPGGPPAGPQPFPRPR